MLQTKKAPLKWGAAFLAILQVLVLGFVLGHAAVFLHDGVGGAVRANLEAVR